MIETYIIVLVVFVFSVVQSLFGVGILVFGTPTCLVLGFPFDVTLSYLLPASIGISILQILHGRNEIKMKNEFMIFTVPFIILALSLVLMKWIKLDMKIIVGIMLVLTGIIRALPRLYNLMKIFLKKNLKIYLIGMGVIHGLSNMGGGLLTILSISLFNGKNEIRANIAYGYLIFAVTQILVLAILNPSIFNLKIIIFPFISTITYIFLGNIIFRKSKEGLYQNLITVFILVYGIILLINT